MGDRRIVLLGPQSERQTVAEVLRDLRIDGPVAVVTAGWEERESEVEELSVHVGGRDVSLGLYPRAEDVFARDPEVRALLYERFDRLRELQSLYRLRLSAQLFACRELFAKAGPAAPDSLHGPEIDDAIDGVRRLDAHHLSRAAELDAEIGERMDAGARPSIARHREELARTLDGVQAVLVAGGHVGVLLNRLRLFDVLGASGGKPVVAWSGGAMVLAERIVLFHDTPPQGPGDAEVYAPGLGLARGVVPLPHARHRLRLDDPARIALFARRFAPDECVALDGGERLDGAAGSAEWTVAAGTRVLCADGRVSGEEAA